MPVLKSHFFLYICLDNFPNSIMAYHIIIILLLIIISFPTAISAESHYATYLNNFAPFNGKSTATLDDDHLIICNNFSDDLIITDTITRSGHKSFKFYVRAANLNNDIKGGYKYTDLTDNSTKRIDNTAWGIVWNYTDQDNFYAAIIGCNDPSPHDDIFNNRTMIVNIIKVQNASMSVIKSVNLDKDIDLYTGYNVINVEYDGDMTHIAVGDKTLRYVAEISGIPYNPNSQYGLLAGPASKLSVERIVLRCNPIMPMQLKTEWTMQSLTEHIEKSTDAIEGFYTFFDKELNEDILKTGGRYTLALVKNGNRYDIIYVNGASVNGSEWTCGMLKGSIAPTQFIDNYSLLWYDAMMKPFDKDVYATIENYTLLSLYFPAQKSMIRFAKTLDYKKR